MKRWTLGAAFAATAILAGCGGSLDPSASGPRFVARAPVPNYDATTNGSFGLGIVQNGRFYFPDRNNKAVQVYNTATNALIGSITGFTGCSAGGLTCIGTDDAKSGPNGINAITGTNLIFVSDVDRVMVVDTTNSPGTVVKTISFGSTGADAGLRADKGCFDADDKIYMVATPDAVLPFYTFISTATQQVIAKLTIDGGRFDGALGNEQCRYDPTTKNFYSNNGGTNDNPRGELQVIPANLITPFLATPMAAGTSKKLGDLGPTVLSYPLPNCDPTGLALGPASDIMVGCRPGDPKDPLDSLILNRTTGAIVATVAGGGGGDQLEYDAVTNRYYNAANRWHASGINDLGGDCSATNPCAPVVTIINAATRAVVVRLATGNNAHGLAVDGVSKRIFNPISSAGTPAGCATCASNPNFLSGGVAIFATQ